MGIRKYYNKYRAAISINGKMTQPYFDTEAQAKEYIENMKAILDNKKSPWAIYSKKRATANCQDLPVGFGDSKASKHLSSGTTMKFRIISCTFNLNGKLTYVRCNYGNKYTREEAILIVTRKVLERLKEKTNGN